MEIGRYRDKLDEAGFDTRLVWSHRVTGTGALVAKLDILGPFPSRAYVTSVILEQTHPRNNRLGLFAYFESTSAKVDHDVNYLRGLVAARDAEGESS